MHINCYPLIFKLRVIDCYCLKHMSIKDLINLFKISRSSLYNWIKLYKKGILYEKKKYHKMSKYNENIKEYIIKYVITKVNFNYRKLIKLIKSRFNVDCSKSSIYLILKEKNITRKRIKIKTNFSNKLKMKQMIKDLKKNVKIVGKENIISIDESSFDTHINSHYGWNIKGMRLVAIKRQQRIRYSVVSAISADKIINVNIVKGSINSVTFIEFIKSVVNKIKNNKILFMDNARIHHSKLFTSYAKTINNKILYNVPYCSELNPIEMVFSKVKSIVHKRNNNSNLNDLQRNIKYGFNKITKSNLRGYYNKCLTF